MSNKTINHQHVSMRVSIAEGVFIESSSSSSFPLTSYSNDSFLCGYSKRSLPFHMLMQKVTNERRVIFKEEIEKEYNKRLEALKAEKRQELQKMSPAAGRTMDTELTKTVWKEMFEEEQNIYVPYEKEYWEILEQPFPSRAEWLTYECRQKKEKEIELALGESQCKLDEIFRRKMIAAKESSISLTPSRKKKVFKSRR